VHSRPVVIPMNGSAPELGCLRDARKKNCALGGT
jgi:hypothetical protein